MFSNLVSMIKCCDFQVNRPSCAFVVEAEADLSWRSTEEIAGAVERLFFTPVKNQSLNIGEYS